MADYNSSLPVRTQNNGDVVVKVADGTTPSQELAIDSNGKVTVKLNDGSGNSIGSTSGSLNVDVTNTTIAVTQSTTPWVDNITQIGGSNITLGQKTSANSVPVVIASDQSTINVTVATPLPAGTNNIGKVSIQDSSGNPFSPTNPLFVSLSDTVGSSVDSYQTSVALAAGSSVNMDYTVTSGKTFYTRQVIAAGSGKIKLVVQYETGVATGVFNTFWVGFNSTSNPNILIPTPTDKTQIAGARIRLVLTNSDVASQDVYSTLSGTEQ